MRKKKKWVLLVIVIVVIAVTAVLYIQSHPKEQAMQRPTDQAGASLKFKATRENIVSTIDVKGKSSYEKETWVYAPFGAKVSKWHVKEGDQVKKGDLLFELDETQLRRDIETLEINERKLQLEQKLKAIQQSVEEQETDNTGVSTETEALKQHALKERKKVEDELERINASLSRKELEEKQKQLAKAKYYAPDSGIFLFHENKEPQAVAEDEKIGKIVDLSKIRFIATVGEEEVFQIKPGMPVEVRVAAMKQTKLRGKVAQVSKFARSGTEQSGSSAQFDVTIALEPDERLIAGLTLTGKIETAKKQGALVVPTIAVQRENDSYFVYVEKGQSVEKRTIQIGMETADKTEVLEGIEEGETVVLQ